MLDLSQKDTPMPDTYRFGRFEVRPRERQLLVGDEPAPLGSRAFDLLMALIERRERVVAKNELLDIVWPGLVVEENNLQVQVSSLRKLVGPQAIATIPGRGYRFTATLDVPAARRSAMPALHAVRDAATGGTPSRNAQPTSIGNLPAAAPRLIGRDDELHALTALLHAHRLVTMVGAAGMGKTVLALAAARAVRDRFPDGVFVVELAPLADPALVPGAVAQALGVTQGGDASGRDQLLRALAAQSLLLVLDNCEHVVEAAGQLADELVARTSGVRVLATSQEFMNVASEKVFKVDPLGVPGAGQAARRDAHPAVALFVERAQAVDPRFALNAGNADAVADICRRLDGVPLAIELAAARVRLLGAQGVRDKLGERFRLLTGGARSALPRHQTLRAAIDWSHGLLSADERAVFRRLGVFVGGFTLELAQRVASGDDGEEWTVLDALGTLVDKSLVVAGAADPPRYRLLETTRAYALEQLAACGETATLVRRHAEVMRDLFVSTDEARFGEHGTLTLAQYMRALTPEIDNLRAALDWTIESEPRIGIALAGAGMELLRMLGHSQEAMRAMLALRQHADAEVGPRDAARFWRRLGCLGSKGALDAAGSIEAQRRAGRIYRDLGLRRGQYLSLYFLGWRLNEGGATSEARAILPELAALEDRTWPSWLRGLRLNLLQNILAYEGRFDEALAAGHEMRALLEGVPGEELSLRLCENNLCAVLNFLGRHEEAIALARVVIEHVHALIARGGAFPSIAGNAMQSLAHAQILLGQYDEALQTVRDALPAWRRDGTFVYACLSLALLVASRDDFANAARIAGAADALMRRSGVCAHPCDRVLHERLQARFEEAKIDTADVERWREEGFALDEAQVAALCLGEREARTP